MNAILIVADTLRRDHLGCYGNSWIRTPHLDAFAESAAVFDRAYLASFPTVPHRADLVTGRYTLTYRGWAPLDREERTLARQLGAKGWCTMLVADTPHILADGYGFQRDYAGWEWIRGQEGDRWRTQPRVIEWPCHPSRSRDETVLYRHLRNTAGWTGEDDRFCARSVRTACEWLEANHREPFLLHLDLFDPHEPWDAPRELVDLYDPGYQGEELIYPHYGATDRLTPEELRHVRAMYAAEVTLVDRWIGRLIETVDRLGRADDTVVIVTSDHGFCLGEHELLGKGHTRGPEGFRYCPLWEEIARIPLLVRGPEVTPGRRGALVQPPDLAPTVLDLLWVDPPARSQGRSLAPILRGESQSVRDCALSSPWLADRERGGVTTFTMGRWSLLHVPRAGAGECRSMLFDLETDPAQARDLLGEQPSVALAMHRGMLDLLADHGAPPEELEARADL